MHSTFQCTTFTDDNIDLPISKISDNDSNDDIRYDNCAYAHRRRHRYDCNQHSNIEHSNKLTNTLVQDYIVVRNVFCKNINP